MAQKDLIPLGKDVKHDAEVRAKLKGSGSPKRVIAQQIRRMKEKPQKYDKEIFELITNPEASAVQICEMIKEATKMDLKPMEFIQLIRTVVDKHKAFFGTKVEVKGDFTADIVLQRIRDFKKEKKKQNGNDTTRSME